MSLVGRCSVRGRAITLRTYRIRTIPIRQATSKQTRNSYLHLKVKSTVYDSTASMLNDLITHFHILFTFSELQLYSPTANNRLHYDVTDASFSNDVRKQVIVVIDFQPTVYLHRRLAILETHHPGTAPCHVLSDAQLR